MNSEAESSGNAAINLGARQPLLITVLRSKHGGESRARPRPKTKKLSQARVVNPRRLNSAGLDPRGNPLREAIGRIISGSPFLNNRWRMGFCPRDSSLLTIPCSNPTWSKFKSCWLFFYSRYLNIYFSWRVINQRVKYLWNRVWKVNFPLFHCPWIALTRAERSLRRDKEAAKKGKEGERNGLGWKGKKKYPRKTRKKRKKCHVKLEDGKGESNSPSLQRFSFFFLRPVHRIIPEIWKFYSN